MNLFDAQSAVRSPAPARTQTQPGRRARGLLRPEALSLLGEVLARLPGVAQPVVQIVPACQAGNAAQVARDFAAAAAIRFGRTLLVSAAGAGDQSAARGLSWLMTELGGSAPQAIVPDTGVAGLHHVRANLHDGALPLERWLIPCEDFRMVVIESLAIVADPGTTMTAARSHGSVLVVAAGITRLDEVQTAARQLAGAGAQVLGTVLHDAPTIGFRFSHADRRH